MKKLTLILLFSLGWGHLGAWDLHSGINYLQGFTYAGQISPGWSGIAVDVEGFGRWEGLPENFHIGCGVEVAVAGLGTQVILPLALKWEASGQQGWNWGLSSALLPGFTFTRPRLILLWGVETQISGGWNWSPGSGIRLSTGLRFTSAPEYSAKVSDYSILDIPLKMYLVFKF